jgi:hypothetical protein
MHKGKKRKTNMGCRNSVPLMKKGVSNARKVFVMGAMWELQSARLGPTSLKCALLKIGPEHKKQIAYCP